VEYKTKYHYFDINEIFIILLMHYLFC